MIVLPKRVEDKILVNDDTGCWEWQGCTNSNGGYGRVYFGRRSQVVHRYVYELLKNQIPEGAELDHLCYNRICCNPEHLEPVTHRENMRRGRQRLPQEVIDKILSSTGSCASVAAELGVGTSTVHKYRKGSTLNV
jgi:hypothetical protein